MNHSIESEARSMGFSPEAATLIGQSNRATQRVKSLTRQTSDTLWTEAEKAAERYYAGSAAPHRAEKEYAYAMGYYHAKRGNA